MTWRTYCFKEKQSVTIGDRDFLFNTCGENIDQSSLRKTTVEVNGSFKLRYVGYGNWDAYYSSSPKTKVATINDKVSGSFTEYLNALRKRAAKVTAAAAYGKHLRKAKRDYKKIARLIANID